jgi:hypothetical protein
MTINQEILNFSNSCPKWMRDLIRRIAQQTRLTANDMQDVLANLKESEGLCTAGSCTALDASHLSGRTSTSHDSTILVSISDVRNANQLAPNQTMPFAIKGMTIIYGYNGSGKTGYGRILRQLCRSRHENKQAILGNVYGSRSGGPATATVAYRVGKADRILQWKDGIASPDELAYISVFDASTAPLYADRQNKIEFLPMGLDILPQLGDACRMLSGTLDIEILALSAKINVPLPTVKSQKYKTFFSRLSAMGAIQGWPSMQDIDAHCTWSAALDGKLAQLEEEIKKVSEPAQILARNNRLKQATDALYDRLEGITKQLNMEGIQYALAKFEAAKSAREAATIARVANLIKIHYQMLRLLRRGGCSTNRRKPSMLNNIQVRHSLRPEQAGYVFCASSHIAQTPVREWPASKNFWKTHPNKNPVVANAILRITFRPSKAFRYQVGMISSCRWHSSRRSERKEEH